MTSCAPQCRRHGAASGVPATRSWPRGRPQERQALLGTPFTRSHPARIVRPHMSRIQALRWPSLVLWIILCEGTGWFASPWKPGAWHTALVKPPWNPPSSVFFPVWTCLLYTSDAADEEDSVDLGGRRII